jgi:hypothetical protein
MPDVLGSVPASEELPRVVAAFRAHRAQKTSEFLDLSEQTNIVRLDVDRSVGARSFMARKQKNSKP